MLRLKRLAVLTIFAFCVVTGFTFWALRVSGAETGGVDPPPPRSEAKLEVLSTGSDPAVNITPGSFDAQWLGRTAARTDIPVRALRAYAAAAGAGQRGRPRPAGSAGTRWRPSASSNPPTEPTAAEA